MRQVTEPREPASQTAHGSSLVRARKRRIAVAVRDGSTWDACALSDSPAVCQAPRRRPKHAVRRWLVLAVASPLEPSP